jgi:hypothetical protein
MASLSVWALSSIAGEICLRAGLPYDKINLNQLGGTVEGFYTSSAHAAYSAIETLSMVYFFDVCNFDGITNFIHRGNNSVANITIADLVDDGSDINKETRRDSISVPRVYNFEYYDINGGLSPDKQTSDRSIDARSKSEVRLETTILMEADQAAQTAVINHKVAIEEQRGGKEFSLPDSWIWLTVGDIVTLDGERLRITEIEIDDGFQNYKTTHDRQSSYSSAINGVPLVPPSDPPTLIVGDTVLQFIDSHILKDSDDRLGYYVGISGASEAWTGAFVELSRDGGTSYPENITASVGCIMGTLTTVLPTHNRYYPDDKNVLTVELLRSDSELVAASLTEMMNRTNLAIVGNELINFSEAVEISPNIWEVSYLLRGRKGSGIIQHEIGERFVLLDRSRLSFIDAELYELSMNLTFRATTFGASSGTVQTVAFTGKSQTERTPGYLQAYRVGANIVASWQGAGRLGGMTSIGMGQYFTGYRVTINGTPQDTTAQTLTFTDPGGSVTIRVQQINSLTGVGDYTEITI